MKVDIYDVVSYVILSVIVAFGTAVIIGGCTVNSINRRYYEQKAIQNDAAHYNPKTGRFEWLNESEDKND